MIYLGKLAPDLLVEVLCILKLGRVVRVVVDCVEGVSAWGESWEARVLTVKVEAVVGGVDGLGEVVVEGRLGAGGVVEGLAVWVCVGGERKHGEGTGIGGRA
jgi:hypothetical protein